MKRGTQLRCYGEASSRGFDWRSTIPNTAR